MLPHSGHYEPYYMLGAKAHTPLNVGISQYRQRYYRERKSQCARWTAPTAWMASGIMAAELSSHPDSFAIRQLLGSNEQVSHASHPKLASACLDESIVR